MAARLVDDLADVVLGVAVPLDQLPIALRLLDRVEILALDILDQRELGRRRLRRSRGRSPGSRAAAPAAPRASAARRRRSVSRRRRARSRIGWSTPRSRIESASSSSASSSNWMRGWLGLGRMRAISISRTPPRPRSAAAGAGPRRPRRAARRGPCRGPSPGRRRSCRLRQLAAAAPISSRARRI